MNISQEFYEKRKNNLRTLYWPNDASTNIYWTNGFKAFPEEIYMSFCPLIQKDGKIIDLGCGNGLLLHYLIKKNPYSLVPFGIDFIDLSIEQAKKIIFPSYAHNFFAKNLLEYDFAQGPFDFILFDPYHLHSNDLSSFIQKLLHHCAANGKIIFYAYPDELKAFGYHTVKEFKELNRLSLKDALTSEKISISYYEKT